MSTARTSTDYDFPLDWPDLSSEEKHQWFCEDRAMRRYLMQAGVSSEALRDGDVREMCRQMRSFRAHNRR